jgi:DNA-binding response OmpR family regulator
MSRKSKNLVFIVDDDPDDRQIILEAFLENHPAIDYAFIETADELLLTLHREDTEFPNLILLDLNMPGILGLQALREMRGNKKFSQIPIIVLTTSTLDKDRSMSYEFGASCFLTKPDSYGKLVDIVNAIIRLWFFEN